MSVNDVAQDWIPEDPCVISRAEYKLYYTEFVYIGEPVEKDTAHGTSGVDTSDINKVWIKRYSATDSSSVPLGVSIRNMFAKGHANHMRAGTGPYRRDMALIQWGIILMRNCGSAAVTNRDRVAPYYDSAGGYAGFKKWVEGEKILGYSWQEEIPAGMFGMIFVDVASTPANTASLGDLSDTTITTPSAGEILQYHAVNGWTNQDLTVAECTDVTITAAADGDILKHNGTVWVDVAHEVANIEDVTETSIATGQTLMWNGTAYVNATLKSELIASPVTTGDNHVFTAAGTPLAIVDVFASGADQVPDVKYLYDATATVPTLSYNWSAAEISTNKATDADTHILVTYWYDENA